MFTGIVQANCELISVREQEGLKTFEVKLPDNLTQGLVVGASVANNGVCLTATRVEHDRAFFDVMEETLKLTNLDSLRVNDKVNIERSLTFGSEIGGHIISGHIHTKAKVTEVSNTNSHFDLTLEVEPQWMNYIFYKGFVGVNGCSLTVGAVTTNSFKLHLIPETLNLTNLDQCKVGDELNIEIDSQTQAIVETVERVLAAKGFA
ncbi:riboflavin synthase subunit alpha [Shewanella gelidii]|uniref:Riboflavin synthase n=1 Tax=Shewanella gelidii TaxID=1642821 RepID=A0A917JUF2_9GAMM|nr:riboflavin synthase subunit alpha [Shewanella gelidii]MCL1098008.1 riboflavin synthase subunit alpha [Shewanella gelidii]GGI85404.1 riboflavin synthase subunit alpha [Shewanella gelidii]